MSPSQPGNVEDIVKNPPPKNPYFSLPDASNFVPETYISRLIRTNFSVSIVDLFGIADRMTEQKKSEFLLCLLKYSKWDVDFEAVAKEWRLASSDLIKTRLRIIVEGNGLRLDEDLQVVDPVELRPVKKIKTNGRKTDNRGLLASGRLTNGEVEKSKSGRKKKNATITHEGDIGATEDTLNVAHSGSKSTGTEGVLEVNLEPAAIEDE